MKTPLLGPAIPSIPITAGSIGVSDPGGVFGGEPLTLQQVIDLIAAGLAGPYLTKTGGEGHTIDTSHPTLSGAVTFDLGNGNVHSGTLTADTTISAAGWPATERGYLHWSIEGDGASTPTFSGVTWVTDAPGVIGPGDWLHGFLFSDDGGTVIWGVMGGGGSTSSGGMVPFYIDTAETFTVPANKQALFAETIDGPGTLDVVGHLIEVS